LTKKLQVCRSLVFVSTPNRRRRRRCRRVCDLFLR